MLQHRLRLGDPSRSPDGQLDSGRGRQPLPFVVVGFGLEAEVQLADVEARHGLPLLPTAADVAAPSVGPGGLAFLALGFLLRLLVRSEIEAAVKLCHDGPLFWWIESGRRGRWRAAPALPP